MRSVDERRSFMVCCMVCYCKTEVMLTITVNQITELEKSKQISESKVLCYWCSLGAANSMVLTLFNLTIRSVKCVGIQQIHNIGREVLSL